MKPATLKKVHNRVNGIRLCYNHFQHLAMNCLSDYKATGNPKSLKDYEYYSDLFQFLLELEDEIAPKTKPEHMKKVLLEMIHQPEFNYHGEMK